MNVYARIFRLSIATENSQCPLLQQKYAYQINGLRDGPKERRPQGGEMTDEAFVQAIEDFKATKTNALGVGDICTVYKVVKPILSGVLPFLKLIPKIGETIAEALTALMAALDKFCPTSPVPAVAKT
jgi:hypothetical protein